MGRPTLDDASSAKRLYYAHIACRKTTCVEERWMLLAMAIWGDGWREAIEALQDFGRRELEFQQRCRQRAAEYAA